MPAAAEGVCIADRAGSVFLLPNALLEPWPWSESEVPKWMAIMSSPKFRILHTHTTGTRAVSPT